MARVLVHAADRMAGPFMILRSVEVSSLTMRLDRMKRWAAILPALCAVLAVTFSIGCGAPQNRGRYQIIAQSSFAPTLLLDTATGRTWRLVRNVPEDSKPSDGQRSPEQILFGEPEKQLWEWIPMGELPGEHAE